jgi:hypothetical protein
MFRKREEEEGLARLAAWAVRNRALALRDEVTRPWHRGPQTPEAEFGRWVGLGLAVGSLVVGVGLAIIVNLSED